MGQCWRKTSVKVSGSQVLHSFGEELESWPLLCNILLTTTEVFNDRWWEGISNWACDPRRLIFSGSRQHPIPWIACLGLYTCDTFIYIESRKDKKHSTARETTPAIQQLCTEGGLYFTLSLTAIYFEHLSLRESFQKTLCIAHQD